MMEIDPNRILVHEKIDYWTKKRKLLYTTTAAITGFTIGIIIGIYVAAPVTSFVISVDAILITLDVALISFVTSWVSSEWGRVASLTTENSFNDMRHILAHIISIIDPKDYEKFVEYKKEEVKKNEPLY